MARANDGAGKIHIRRGAGDWKDIGLRFAFGGGAVVVCYLLSATIFSPTFAGIFAAFPAVMSAAVIITGIRNGDKDAAQVAQGAVAGMVGGAACVSAALAWIRHGGSWAAALGFGLMVWFACSLVLIRLFRGRLERKDRERYSSSTGTGTW